MSDARRDDVRQRIIAGLSNLGVHMPTGRVTPTWREWRWIAQIGANRVCHFAESNDAGVRLDRERQLLCALEGRVTCAIPSVLAASDDGRLQVRSMVLGDQIQRREFEIGTSKGWERIAETYGAAIASLHHAIDPGEAAVLVQPRPENLPYAAELLRPLADRWIRDRGLAGAVSTILDHYAAICVVPKDRVLIHGDLIADNTLFHLPASVFIGMFDFADAEVTDRHLDLKYIHSFGKRFADSLMAAYENEAEVTLDRQRPAVYHIASAVSHLKAEIDQDVPLQRERVEKWVRTIIDDALN